MPGMQEGDKFFEGRKNFPEEIIRALGVLFIGCGGLQDLIGIDKD